jgi:hypothetical protein
MMLQSTALLSRTYAIKDPSLCLLKEGAFSFRFGLKIIDPSTDTKSVRRAPFDNLNGSTCFPVKSGRILLYFDSDDVPAI